MTDVINGPGDVFAGAGITFAGAPSFGAVLGGGPAGSGGVSRTLGLILGGTGPSTRPAGRRMGGAEAGCAFPVQTPTNLQEAEEASASTVP